MRCVLISTEVSPLANFFKSTCAGFCPRRSQMLSTSHGWLEPLKIWQPRIVVVVERGAVVVLKGQRTHYAVRRGVVAVVVVDLWRDITRLGKFTLLRVKGHTCRLEVLEEKLERH